MRYYTNSPYGYDRSPSVTTILGILNKPWLTDWASKTEREMCAKLAWSAYEGLRRFENEQDVLDYFSENKQDFKRISKEAMDTGSLVHSMIECYYKLWIPLFYSNYYDEMANYPHSLTAYEAYQFFLSDYYPSDALKMLSAWFQAVKENNITILDSERTVHHPDGFSGTLDFLCRISGMNGVYLGDIKTGEPERIGDPTVQEVVQNNTTNCTKIYNNCIPRVEHRWQTEAYRRCPGAKVEGQTPNGRAIIYLRKKQLGRYCMWIDDDPTEQIRDWDCFKACKTIFEMVNGG